jgi:hypothetical protein
MSAVSLCRRYAGGGLLGEGGRPLPLALPDDPDLQRRARYNSERYTTD